MLRFTKMEGIGNDYVYVDVTNKALENASEVARKVSDRHFGIGSDGLILIGKSRVADFKMNIYNADGSEAEMCGNGIRCVGKYVYDKGLTDKTEIKIETLAGVKDLKLYLKDGKVDLVSVDMGEPILDADKIPVLDYVKEEGIQGRFVKVKYCFDDDLTCVSMGNPHAVCYTSDVLNIDIEEKGLKISEARVFPNRTNVEFVQVINKNEIKMRVWERGAGETLACGTGASASVVASFLNGYTDRKVLVHLLGGTLEINYALDNHVYLKGPARLVFEGEIDLD